MKDKNHDINEELLARWINGNISPADKQKVQVWSEQSMENKKLLEDITQVDDEIEQLKLMESINSQQALQQLKGRLTTAPKKGRQWLVYWQKIAAVVLIPLLIVQVLMLIPSDEQKVSEIVWNEISTPPGLRSEFQLPDGSTVWLNANTRLKYPMNFAGDQRLVELEGEALFEVCSNPQHPFVVDAGAMQVEATGTSFNVMAYRDAEHIQTALIEGKVNLYSKHGNELEQRATLMPGQLGVYNITSNKLLCEDEKLDKYIAWREGTLLFRNDSMEEVLLKIGRWYNVDFEIIDEIDERHAYTGEFKGEPLSQVLEYIELTTPVEFMETKIDNTINKNEKRIINVRNKK